MLEEITRQNLGSIRNSTFRHYARIYVDIYESFLAQVGQFGLPFETDAAPQTQIAQERAALRTLPEITSRCDGASLVYRHISPACEVCKQGVNTLTSHISFRCHRNCFFCFNPNQENFEAHLAAENDWRGELESYHHAGQVLTHIALTGGEPLLHPTQAAAFFHHARELYPEAHLRLYTSGDLLDEAMLVSFRDAGLDEIRFSYKMEDAPEGQLLSELIAGQGSSVSGYYNAEAFRARGFRLRYPPYRTLYNFWYAGGLPVAGSELSALRLLQFAAEEKLSLGVHYCSLENKNFGQMYQQNHHPELIHPTLLFSERDYYLKTVKAFGEDAVQVKKLFDKRGNTRYLYDPKAQYIQLHPADAVRLQGRRWEFAVSVNVLEERDGEPCLRELKLLRASAADCDPAAL